jgi:DNA-3-methyladenine glycosylase II
VTEPRSILVPPEAVEHLRRTDPIMSGLVARLGRIEYTVDGNLWRSVVGSIVGQQLSVAAARTIRRRVAELGGDGFPTPSELLALPVERLRQCGLSGAKARYVRDAAEHWLADGFEEAELADLDDEAVIRRLVVIKGVGRWTAEMVLLFGLGRPDVLAVDDLGIRAAVQRAYDLSARPSAAALTELAEPWRPQRSYASLYLWRSLAVTPA